MKRVAVCLAVALGSLALLGALSPAPALALASSPGFALDVQATPTAFSAGDDAQCLQSVDSTEPLCDAYTVTVTNAGAAPTNGSPITITDTLPPGLTVQQTRFGGLGCSEPSQRVLQCRWEGVLSPGGELQLLVEVTVNEGSTGPLTNLVDISGGGAPSASTNVQSQIGGSAPFGPASFSLESIGSEGLPDGQAGEHPSELTATIDLNNAFRIGAGGSLEATSAQDLKDLVIDLPPGMLANPTATPRCTFTEFYARQPSGCPADTAVGHIRTEPERQEALDAQIYNMVPERGFPAEFAFADILGFPHALYASVIPSAAGYLLRVTISELPRLSITKLVVTLFGDPGAKDGSANTPLSLLTNPTSCDGQPLAASVHLDSWQDPAGYDADGTPDLEDPGWVTAHAPTYPEGLTGCNLLQFNPSLTLLPEAEHAQADEPAGYYADLEVPQSVDPSLLATPALRNVTLTFPAGLAISPAAAPGLAVCQAEGSAGIELGNPEAGHCPGASTVGEAEVLGPVLEQPLRGRVYLAAPRCGAAGQPPCSEEAAETGRLFALYVEAGSEASGVHLKLGGEIEVGGDGRHSRQVGLQPGQLRASFTELPQLALSELRLHFYGGPRALLANPQTCGTFVPTSELTPWSAPDSGPAATSTDSFQISGCQGHFSPSFSAGALNLQGGASSQFTLTISRQDLEPDLSKFTVRLPPGVTAKIGGLPECREALANTASCPTDSRIGLATIVAGSGAEPLSQSATVYLTGPYAGAPFGLAIVIPGALGPFDLASVVLHAGIYIDPSTAQITMVSDPLPQSLDGVSLRLRTITLTIEREGLIFNPTNCSPLSVNGTLTSAQGATATVSSHFQVANCASLKFSPKLTASTHANGEFSGHGASLHIVITTATGQTNMRSLKLDLPQRLPARLGTIQHACAEDVFDANPARCPKASLIGSAKVYTAILATPMAGPAYLVAKEGASASAFPNMVLVLQAQGVRIDLTGALYVSVKNVTSTTFKAIPDVPMRRLELALPEGSHSILAATADPCKKTPHLEGTFTGQNGASVRRTVKISVSGCPHKRKRRSTKKR